MEPVENRRDYLLRLSAEILWPRARRMVCREVSDHLEDALCGYLEEGMEREEAEKRAVRDMGDPRETGRDLNRIHRPRPDRLLLGLMLGLALFGLAIQFMVHPEGFNRHLAGVAAALLAGLAAWFPDTDRWPARWVLPGLLASGILLSAGAPVVNGAVRGAAYLFLLFPVALAMWTAELPVGRRKAAAVWIMTALAVILAVRSAGFTMGLYVGLAGVIFGTGPYREGESLAPVRIRRGAMILAGLAGAYLALVTSPYRQMRYSGVLSPGKDPLGNGWLTLQIRRLLTGSESLETAVLPGAHTDFLLTWLIHRNGWMALMAVLVVFSILLIRIRRRSLNLRGRRQRQMVRAVFFSMLLQLVVYLAANLGFPLLTPLALPFVSYGASFLVVQAWMSGWMLAALRDGRYPDPVEDSVVSG